MKSSKLILFVVLGIIFWFNAAMIVRLLGENVFTENNPKLFLLFVLAVPLTILSLYIAKAISKCTWVELLRPVVIMTFTATFLDGIALTWFRQLYSQSYGVALHGAGLIFWAAGLGLLFAYYLDSKARKAKN
jgi:hypothetical protein